MGKSLDGKELGHGILQKKNGRYEARYTDRFGNIYAVNSDNNKLGKVIFIDNPFGAAKDIYIWERIKRRKKKI